MCDLNVENYVIPQMIVHIENVFNRFKGHNVTHYKIHTDFRFFVCLLDIARALARRHVSSARASRGPSIPNTTACYNPNVTVYLLWVELLWTASAATWP